MNTQQIRRSQFIFTYGPGAILEGENGSMIIPSLENGLDRYFTDENLENFEINDTRMSNLLERIDSNCSSPRIFSLPSNAALKIPEYLSIYNNYNFPMWRICYNKTHKYPLLFKGKECPVCHNKKSPNVRFVAACPEGHLDEVNWNWAVHKGEKCGTYYFNWKAKGSSLADIIIECANPSCKASTNLEEIYKTNFLCTGRKPEQEDKDQYYYNQQRKQGCKGKMKVIQRQSTALRIPETVSLLTIPQYDNSTIRVLQRNDVKGPVKMSLGIEDKERFLENIKLADLPEATLSKIKGAIDEMGYPDFVEYTKELYEKKMDVNTIIEEEFESLRGSPRLTDNFLKKKPVKHDFPFYDEFNMEIHPVEKLRTVTVQVGYRRMPYMKKEGSSKLISSSAYSSGSTWFPGFEGIGEGIFITSSYNPLDFVEKTVIDEWDKRRRKKDENILSGSVISWRNGNVRHPQFIWWHTLSHAIIRTLSLVSGYSSASLRERVYTDSAMNRGGVLIYTSSAGEDGGMGGLVETASVFDSILSRAMDSVLFCSNDPLCSEIKITDDSVNGSACHNCLMLSETSCEHGNRWLDRHIMIGD